MSKLTKTLLLAVMLIGLVGISRAATTVTDLGDGHKVVTFTATADTLSPAYNLAGYKINAIRIQAVDGAKTYQLRKGTAIGGTVLWRDYTTSATSGTTLTKESLPGLPLARGNGLYFHTDASTGTLDLYIGPK